MPHSDRTIERVTFDVLRQSKDLESLAALNALFAPAFRALGFRHFATFGHVCIDRVDDLEVLFGQPDVAWYRHYRSLGLAGSDPRLRHMLRSAEPAWLSELASSDGITAPSREFLKELQSFGYTESFVWPIHLPAGPVRGVILLGVAGEPSRDTQVAAVALAQGYHVAGAPLWWSEQCGDDDDPVGLRPRQVECLAWARQGKSSADIGRILGISARTVDEHIAHACEALEVRTRVQAVARAVQLGRI
jgi:DNA-binding CsgD family transcriptional regulator